MGLMGSLPASAASITRSSCDWNQWINNPAGGNCWSASHSKYAFGYVEYNDWSSSGYNPCCAGVEVGWAGCPECSGSPAQWWLNYHQVGFSTTYQSNSSDLKSYTHATFVGGGWYDWFAAPSTVKVRIEYVCSGSCGPFSGISSGWN